MSSHPPPDEAGDLLEQATRLRRQGRLDEAVDILRRLLARAPGNARAWSELAHALRWQDRLDEAREAAGRAAAIEPGLAGAWFNLGAVHAARGETGEAIGAYRRALEIDPGFAKAWSNLGEALAAAGDGPGEIEACRRAVEADPRLAPAWSNLGGALSESERYEEAVTACRRAIELDPEFPAAWNNLGNALRETGEHAAAVRAGERAVQLGPQSAQAWSNLGSALLEQERTGEAFAAHRRALELGPRDARAHFNLGIAQERCRQRAAALDSYRRAIGINPDFGAARLRLACVLLATGDFAEGWPAYERRWQAKNAPRRRFDFAAWDGQRARGRRLLLWGEQGVGDEILHAGMVGELADAGMALTLEVDPRLVTLMQRSFPGIAVIARTDPPAADPAGFDAQAPLASLGRWLRPSFARFPRHAGYLKADAARSARCAERLRSAGPGRRIGISWRSANREFGAAKSLPLADWSPILRTPGAGFVDLQYGATAAERDAARRETGVTVAHFDEVDLHNDLEGLAALCAACDLVVTASNVTAHVAGALGRPVWLLVPRANGRLWYWFADRADSPWYPSMRVFEQDRPGAWRPLLDAVARELAAFIEGA